MTCDVCTWDQPSRQSWGCDEEIDEGVAEVEGCYRCNGGNPECEVCEGSDRWVIKRCPNSVIDPKAAEVCRHVSFLIAQISILPVAGGLRDQSALFMDGLNYTLKLHGRYEDRRKKGRKPTGMN